MKMKINRLVGATRQRNTASIRRTVLYTAVVAAIGLSLAGLPVAGTTPSAQAQSNLSLDSDQELKIVIPSTGNNTERGSYVVRPATARVSVVNTQYLRDNNLGYRLRRSVSSGSTQGTLYITVTSGRTKPGSYSVHLKAETRDRTRSEDRYLTITVVDPKYRVIRTGIGGRDRRVQALREFTTIDKITVHEDEHGGKVSDSITPYSRYHEGSLSHFGYSWIAHDVTVSDSRVKVLDNAHIKDRAILDQRVKIWGDAVVSDNAKIGRNRRVGETRVSGAARVKDNAWVYGNAQVYDNAQVAGNAEVFGNARVYDNAKVWGTRSYQGNRYSGAAKVYGDAQVHGDVEVFGGARIYEQAYVFGTAKVGGKAKISGNTTICGDAVVIDAEISGNSHVGPGAVIYGGVHDGISRGGPCF